MKTCIITTFVLFTIIFNFSILEGREKKVIEIATGEFVPYSGEKLPGKGCLNQVILDSFKDQGYEVKLHFLPWKTLYNDTKEGEYDASSYWYDKPERRKDMIFPKNHLSVENNYFYYNKSNAINSISDLKKKTIALQRGYTYLQEVLDGIKKYDIEVIKVDSEAQAFKMILSGNADATIMTQKVFEAKIINMDQKSKEKIGKSTKVAMVVKGFLLFSRKIKNGEELKETFDKGFEKIMVGKYKANYQKNCSLL